MNRETEREKKFVWKDARKNERQKDSMNSKEKKNNLCNCTHEGNVLHMLVIPTHEYYTIPKKYERIQGPSNELNETMSLVAIYSL